MATILENVYTLSAHLEDAYSAIEAKGGTVPAQKNAANLSVAVDGIPVGGSDAKLFDANLELNFTGLTAIPTNPLGSNSVGKFRYWANIKSASFPDLTSVGNYSCYHMFENCTSLTSVPSLPATSLGTNCYYEMFTRCTSLSAAPSLPATTLSSNCYTMMFRGCSSLTAAPTLSATTLANGCYQGIFYQCTYLTQAPAELPVTTLAENCYYAMFQGCTRLATTPELPAAALANYCYCNMFSGCTALTGTMTIPVLNTNTSIPSGAFLNMFQGCRNLTKVILDFSTFSSIPTLGSRDNVNVFESTTDTRFEIHVPSSLVDSWKTASNWSTWANMIVGV